MSSFWKIFTSVIITAIVVGGGIFYAMGKQIDSIRADNQTKMDGLSKQIATLKSSSVDSTADWKTYTSSYGYSFKYPIDWILDVSDSKSVTINSPENEALKTQATEVYTTDITFNYFATLSDADGNNPKKYQSFSDWINDKGYFSGMTNITLAGITAYEGVEGGFGAYYVNVAEHDSHFFKILFGNVESKSGLTATDSKVLSTFQFTK